MKSIASPSEKQRPVKKRPSSKASRTDLEYLRNRRAYGRPTEEHPELQLNDVVRGIVRRGLKQAQPKSSISLRVDADVLDWFKSQGEGYQTRMNAVLKAFRDASV
jgi:uncharacterized protein (DUF4415 family)